MKEKQRLKRIIIKELDWVNKKTSFLGLNDKLVPVQKNGIARSILDRFYKKER